MKKAPFDGVRKTKSQSEGNRAPPTREFPITGNLVILRKRPSSVGSTSFNNSWSNSRGIRVGQGSAECRCRQERRGRKVGQPISLHRAVSPSIIYFIF